jgi:hypothetical protein
VTVTVHFLDPGQVSIPHDRTYPGRRVVSLQIAGELVRVELLGDIDVVAAVIHRADVLLQARLAMAPAAVADEAIANGTKAPKALRHAVGVDDHGEVTP